MILINFANAFNAYQVRELEILAGESLGRTFRFRIVTESDMPIARQLLRLMEKLSLTPEEIAQEIFVVNLPNHNVHAALVVAALYKRLGFFPRVVRTRPSMYSIPPRTEVVELLDLQEVNQP